MTDEETINAVTAKLMNGLYIGQYVRCRNLGITGEITAFQRNEEGREYAVLSNPNTGQTRHIFTWALEPL